MVVPERRIFPVRESWGLLTLMQCLDDECEEDETEEDHVELLEV